VSRNDLHRNSYGELVVRGRCLLHVTLGCMHDISYWAVPFSRSLAKVEVHLRIVEVRACDAGITLRFSLSQYSIAVSSDRDVMYYYYQSKINNKKKNNLNVL
jgi:hypothetical protein